MTESFFTSTRGLLSGIRYRGIGRIADMPKAAKNNGRSGRM